VPPRLELNAASALAGSAELAGCAKEAKLGGHLHTFVLVSGEGANGQQRLYELEK
jgi:hypothetical protein